MPDLEHRLTADERLVFVHIPKTAGLTFRALLAKHFDVRQSYPRPDEWWWPHLGTSEELSRYRLFNGHYVYSIGEAVRNAVFVTMLRHPVDRLVSTYHYVARTPNAFQHDYVVSRALSLDEFLSDPVTVHAQANWAAGFVASIPAAQLKTHQQKMGHSEAWASGDSLFPNLGASVAAERLESFAMFGLCERFQDSAFMLDFVFGWKPATNYQSFNVAATGNRRADLAPRLVDAVLEANSVDVAMYERASALFEERFHRMCELLLERFGAASHAHMKQPLPPEVMVELLEKHYQQRCIESSPEPRGSFVWDVAGPVEGSGWHSAEAVGPGRHGRWTGPGTVSTLDLRLAPDHDYTVEFELIYAAARAHYRGVELYANGTKISLRHAVAIPGRPRRYRGVIPRRVVGERVGNFVTLEWRVAKTIDAQSIAPNREDARRVGVMFGGLRVTPRRARKGAGSERTSA
ncbi:MAG: sulfotransferase family 2 domain-containing protein [Acidobacteria bacterium]|nr:sulfotransferase family 2 domain-containing protein [Acidobacteriota bacterium]